MPDIDIQHLVRPNIRRLKPYSSARHEFQGEAQVFLDANENPFPNGYNRYPDPYAEEVLRHIEQQKGVPKGMCVLGNGSDEIIDLIFRIFCEPTKDEVIILPPTYGMYRVAADIANVAVREIPLTADFQPNVPVILAAYHRNAKVLWLCSPNNPTGNDLERDKVKEILDNFPGIVVIDEAYIDFAQRGSYTDWLSQYPQLIVMQTFSKAYGLASIRLGMAFANPPIIELFRRVKPPYNVNLLSQEVAVQTLKNPVRVQTLIDQILQQRQWLAEKLLDFTFVKKVFPSDANFLLVEVIDPKALYNHLAKAGIVVRDRSQQPGCAACLRFTVGTPTENQSLLEALAQYPQ